VPEEADDQVADEQEADEQEADEQEAEPRLVGGALCLDFVNTVDPRHAPGRREYLDSYPALVAWSRRAGIIDAVQDEHLREAAAGDPAAADLVLRRAIMLREVLYPVLTQAARRRPPAPDDLESLHAELTSAMAHIRVTWTPQGFTWGWRDTGSGLGQVLWPVTWSAADLLVHGPLDRLRECPGGGDCGWLFLDLSKNGSRRWCEMRSCGNRAKARRHYARAQAMHA
jgi:predicted RNA-binding Zn ribbon-like protein